MTISGIIPHSLKSWTRLITEEELIKHYEEEIAEMNNPPSQQPTTEELFAIADQLNKQNAIGQLKAYITSYETLKNCNQSLTEEIERLIITNNELDLAVHHTNIEIKSLKTLIGEAVEVLDDVNKHAYQRCDEALTKLKEASDE